MMERSNNTPTLKQSNNNKQKKPTMTSTDPYYDSIRETTKSLSIHAARIKSSLDAVSRVRFEYLECLHILSRDLVALCREEQNKIPTAITHVVGNIHMSVEEHIANAHADMAWQKECVEKLDLLSSSLAALKPIKDERKKKHANFLSLSKAVAEKEKDMVKKSKDPNTSKTYAPLKSNCEFSSHEFTSTDASYKSAALRILDRKDVVLASVVQGIVYILCSQHCSLGKLFAVLYETTTAHLA
eukprot:PhF_6_TR36192/c0_g1_i2/m.52766